MYSKEIQLKKTKNKNDKRLDPCEYRALKDSILDRTNGICQLCGVASGDDFHHSKWGKYGADKIDSSVVLVCRTCHSNCHKDKHGELNTLAVEIGENNWERYSN